MDTLLDSVVFSEELNGNTAAGVDFTEKPTLKLRGAQLADGHGIEVVATKQLAGPQFNRSLRRY